MKKTNILLASTMCFSLLLSGLSATNTLSTSEVASNKTVSELNKQITMVSTPAKKIQTLYNSSVRASAGTKYKVVTSAKKGKVLTSYNTKKVGSTTWHKVKVNDKTGWISSTVVKSYSSKTLKVPFVSQLSPVNAPFGCEGASLLMALKYKGYTNLKLRSFLDDMPKDKGGNPYKGFAGGNPYANQNGVFQSIFPKPLTSYGKEYNSNVANISGYSTAQLKKELDKGNPVIAFVTLDFKTPVWGKWKMGSAGTKKIVDNMHVVTVIGYNSNGSYYIADPNSKKQKYWVSKTKFEKAYNALQWGVVVR
ncbi:C39 family peptidase [Viridibacillus sp. YIM B01967]|uniref:C39 family peptidase n=1 Tax=Viridibacillus soli TaxID=2798301 RepID=A0ABS1H7L0_9BACL|nr:C39 family peptidase [Viridibacillus soli]MBK3495284.1 C39 family peptidase [Viridibacillus soli]